MSFLHMCNGKFMSYLFEWAHDKFYMINIPYQTFSRLVLGPVVACWSVLLETGRLLTIPRAEIVCS